MRRDTKWWLTGLVVGSLAALTWHEWNTAPLGGPVPMRSEVVETFAPILLIVGLGVGLAGIIGSRTAEQHRKMETLPARAELAAICERNRIAREMRDVIAQARGGRYAGKKNPSKALAALDSIAARGRQMRGLLSGLNGDSAEERDVATHPGVGGIPDSVSDAERNGLDVDYRLKGTPAKLYEARVLPLYRVVQECLTNLMKHAGAVERRVLIEWGKEAVGASPRRRPRSRHQPGAHRNRRTHVHPRREGELGTVAYLRRRFGASRPPFL